MNDEKNELHSNSLEAFELLSKIATATSRLEAIKLDFSMHALFWGSEAHGKLSRLDADNLCIVFRVAFEKRMFELASSQENTKIPR